MKEKKKNPYFYANDEMKSIKKYIDEIANYLFLMIYILSIIAFFTGLHNIDNAWNMRYIESKFNTTLCDKALSGKCYSAVEAYQIGFHRVLLSESALMMMLILCIYDNLKRK